MRRPTYLLLTCVLIVGAATIASPTGSSSQDRTDDHIAALETQVAELQTRVTTLEDGQSAGAVADPSVRHDLKGTARLFFIWTANDTPPTEEEACGPESRAVKSLGDGLVTVRDARETIVGSAPLDAPVWEPRESFPLVGYCVFTFTVPNIAESPSYTIQVGDQAKDRYSIGEMIGLNWTIAIKLRSIG